MNGMPVRLTDKRTGFTMEGIYKMKTSDCHVVQTSTGTDTLFKIDEWECHVWDRSDDNPLVKIGRAVDDLTQLFTRAFSFKK